MTDQEWTDKVCDEKTWADRERAFRPEDWDYVHDHNAMQHKLRPGRMISYAVYLRMCSRIPARRMARVRLVRSRRQPGMSDNVHLRNCIQRIADVVGMSDAFRYEDLAAAVEARVAAGGPSK